MPTISVIVPVFKAEPYIRCCVDSILAQTFDNFELILVNDGSPDNSGGICEEYAQKDDRVRVFHQENQGQAAARNHAVAVAKGEWVCFVDSDDAIHPQTLEMLFCGAKDNHAKISVCDVMKAEMCPQWSAYPKEEWVTYRSNEEETLMMFLNSIPHCYWLPCAKLIDISLLKKHPFTEGRIYEDNAVVFKWLYDAGVIAVCSQKCYWYRDNSDGTTRSAFSLKRLDYLWATAEQIRFYTAMGYEQLRQIFCSEYFKMVISNYDSMKGIAVSGSQMRAFRKEAKKLYHCHKRAVVLTDFEQSRLQRILYPYTYKLREKRQQLCKSEENLMRRIIRRVMFEKEMVKSSNQTDAKARDVIESAYAHGRPSFTQSNAIDERYDLMIVVPVYNVQMYLKECLDSVLSQKTQYTYCVVAVDDGSTDGSAEVLKQFEDDARVRVIHQENKGLSGARNTALKEIVGRYVYFLDSDDRLPEGAIEALMSVAFEHDADIVQGAYRKFNENGEIGVFDRVEIVCEIPPAAVSGYACMKAIKAEMFENFCFPEGFLYEDTVMGKLLYPQCQKAVAIPHIVYDYRIHSATISGASQTAKNLDTYWMTQYCLEEAARRGYTLDSNMYEQYLHQCWVNFLRTQYMTVDIQESLFVATAALYETHFGNMKLQTKENKLKLLHRALKKRSFAAYLFLMKRWEIL